MSLITGYQCKQRQQTDKIFKLNGSWSQIGIEIGAGIEIGEGAGRETEGVTRGRGAEGKGKGKYCSWGSLCSVCNLQNEILLQLASAIIIINTNTATATTTTEQQRHLLARYQIWLQHCQYIYLLLFLLLLLSSLFLF